MKKSFLLLLFVSICSSNAFSNINPNEIEFSNHSAALKFVLEGGSPQKLADCGNLEDFLLPLSLIFSPVIVAQVDIEGLLNEASHRFLFAVIKNQLDYVADFLKILKKTDDGDDGDTFKIALNYALKLQKAGINRSEMIQTLRKNGAKRNFEPRERTHYAIERLRTR